MRLEEGGEPLSGIDYTLIVDENAPIEGIVHLKRFNEQGDKVQAAVTIPDVFLGRHLKCIVSHFGETLRNGHYVAHVKVHDIWWVANDRNVVSPLASPADALKKDAYLLLYG